MACLGCRIAAIWFDLSNRIIEPALHIQINHRAMFRRHFARLLKQTAGHVVLGMCENSQFHFRHGLFDLYFQHANKR